MNCLTIGVRRLHDFLYCNDMIATIYKHPQMRVLKDQIKYTISFNFRFVCK